MIHFPFKSLFLTLSFLIISEGLLGQSIINEEASSLENVDLLQLPALDNQSLLKSYNQPQKNQALRFAEPRDINITHSKNGSWESTKSGTTIWRQRIQSPNAFSINLGFTKFKLQPGVSLIIYNKSKTEVIGPFTHLDNDDHLQLWTPMISGQEIVLELQGTAKAIQKSKLELSRLNHDFSNFVNKSSSGSCNLDVICGEEDGWGIVDNYRDIISAVGAYTLNGIDQCTGVLINNTNQDCTPYFITADHCNISNVNAPTVVVYWNYENQTCRQPFSPESGMIGNGPRNTFNSGAIKRASLSDSDFALIELDDPIDPNLNLFFAGWNISPELTDTSICIHHPNVEEKRISFDYDRMAYENGQSNTNFIRVLNWEVGTTEPGSSGAPIFNTQKQFIGQLLGGFASCTNNDFDSFGWINYSWDFTNSSTSNLKSWLDPIGSGATGIDGRYCSFNLAVTTKQFEICNANTNTYDLTLSPSTFFNENVTYSFTELPNGLVGSFLFESGSKNNDNTATLEGFENLEDGDYSFILEVTDGDNVATSEINFSVSSEIPPTPQLKEPLNNATQIPTVTTLNLKRAENGVNEYQVSTKSDFSELIISKVSNFSFVEIRNLKNEQTYFWRVRSSNVCGESSWSEVFQFTTIPSFCTYITSDGPPIEIMSATANEIQSDISFNFPVIIQDVDVQNIKGQHSYLEDLSFELNFNNTDVLLVREICSELDNFDFGFDDESLLNNIECPPINKNKYIPSSSLSKFDQEIAGGLWSLIIKDLADQDGGELEEWTIKVCFNEAIQPVIIPEYNKYTFCDSEPLEIQAFYDKKETPEDVYFNVFDRNGNPIDASVVEVSGKEKKLKVIIETTGILTSSDRYQLAMLSSEDDRLLAFSTVEMTNGGTSNDVVVDVPQNDQVFGQGEFNEIIWMGDSKLATTIEIANDDLFSNIIYSISVVDVNQISNADFGLGNGDFYLRILSKQFCGIHYSNIVKFTIDGETNTTEEQSDVIKIFPNPSNGNFYIKNDVPFTSDTTIELYDINSSYIKPNVQRIASDLLLLNIEDFPSGLYILKLRKQEVVSELKLVKLD